MWPTRFAVGTVNITFSPVGVHELWGLPVEPLVTLGAVGEAYGSGASGGPLEAEAKLAYRGVDFYAGPFVRYSTKSVDDKTPWAVPDREVTSAGGYMEKYLSDRYYKIVASYTPAGTWDSFNFGAITTVKVNGGLRFGKFAFGGIFEVDHSSGNSDQGESQQTVGTDQVSGSFMILRAGPEIKFQSQRFHATLAAEWKVNDDPATLDDLGDLAGHGTGTSSISAGFGYDL